jgi:hypothetical protein
MGTMSESDAAPLPRLGEVFFDVRGNSRSMRLSWYADTGVAVLSIWQGGMCTGTFRLAIGDLPRLVETLQHGPAGRPAERQAGWDFEASGPALADPLMEPTAQVQSMEPLLGRGQPDRPAQPVDYLTGVREHQDHRAEPREYLAGPPDHRAMPPEYRADLPDDLRTGPAQYRADLPDDLRTGPAQYRAGSADYLAGPPDQTGTREYLAPPPDHRAEPPAHRAEPPTRRADPPAHRADPPNHRAEPPAHRAGPPEYQSGPPEYQAGPPDYQAEPPEYRSGPPEYQAGSPEYRSRPSEYESSAAGYRAGPPDYLAGPPEYQAVPPEYQAVPPQPRTEYLADPSPAAGTDPADYGGALYVGSRRPDASDPDTSGTAAYPHDTGGQVRYQREPAGDLYRGPDPLDYHGEPSMPHYPPRTSAPTHSDALGRSPADYPAHYGTAVTDDIGHEPREDSFPHDRPAGSRGARSRHAGPDASST